jgi:hypothetical protein
MAVEPNYSKDGCRIEIWFRDGKRWIAIGSVDPTHWEIEMSRLSRSDN